MKRKSMIETLLEWDEMKRPRIYRGPGPEGAFNFIRQLPVEVIFHIDKLAGRVTRYVWRLSSTAYIS